MENTANSTTSAINLLNFESLNSDTLTALPGMKKSGLSAEINGFCLAGMAFQGVTFGEALGRYLEMKDQDGSIRESIDKGIDKYNSGLYEGAVLTSLNNATEALKGLRTGMRGSNNGQFTCSGIMGADGKVTFTSVRMYGEIKAENA